MKKIQASDNDLLIVTILFSLIGSLLSKLSLSQTWCKIISLLEKFNRIG